MRVQAIPFHFVDGIDANVDRRNAVLGAGCTVGSVEEDVEDFTVQWKADHGVFCTGWGEG